MPDLTLLKVPHTALVVVMGEHLQDFAWMQQWIQLRHAGWAALGMGRAYDQDSVAHMMTDDRPLLLLNFPRTVEQYDWLAAQPGHGLIAAFAVGEQKPEDALLRQRLGQWGRLVHLVSKPGPGTLQHMGLHVERMLNSQTMQQLLEKKAKAA